MNTLPTDILINIFEYLPFDFTKISMLSKQFNVIYSLIKIDVAYNILTRIFTRIPYKSSFAIYDFIYIKYHYILKFDLKLLCIMINENSISISSDIEYEKSIIQMLWKDINIVLENSIKIGHFEILDSLLAQHTPLKYTKIDFENLIKLLTQNGCYNHIIQLLEYINKNNIDIRVYDILQALLLRFPNTPYEDFRRDIDHIVISDIITLLSKSKQGINLQRKFLKTYAHCTYNSQLYDILEKL